MNEWLQKLLQEISSGVSDNTLLKNYPQLGGSADNLTHIKGLNYLVSKKGMPLDQALDYYPEVKGLSDPSYKNLSPAEFEAKTNIDRAAKNYTPPVQSKTTSEVAAQPTTPKPENTTGLSDEQAGQVSSYLKSLPTPEDEKMKQEDPIGYYHLQLNNQQNETLKKVANLQRSDAKPEDFEQAAQQIRTIAKQKKAVQTAIDKTGIDIPDARAKDQITQWIQSSPINQGIDPDRMSVDEIKGYLPQTETAQAILKTYENNRTVRTALDGSRSIEQAAIRWAKANDPKLAEGLDKQTGGSDDATFVAPSQMGTILSQFLKQPYVKNEWAVKNQDNNSAYQTASANLLNHYPEQGEGLVAGKISQHLEDSGRYNGILNRVPSDLDKVVDDMTTKGQLSPQEAALYKKNKVNVILKIQSPGILENAAGSFKDAVANSIGSLNDIEKKVMGLEPATEDALRSKENFDYSQSTYTPSEGHKITSEIGNFVGQAGALAMSASMFKGLGLGTKSSNALAMGLLAESPARQDALEYFPNDPIKREAYTTLVTGLNAAFGTLVPREKALEGLGKLVQPEVLTAINDFTEGKITQSAAKEAVKSAFQNALDKGAEYAEGTLKHSASMTGQMVAMTAAQDVIDKAFGARDLSAEDFGNDIIATAKTAFLAGLPLAGLAAHADISKGSKIAASTLWDIASDPLRYEQLIEQSAGIDPNLATTKDERLANLNLASFIKSDMDETKLFDGLPLEHKQNYLLQSLSQKVLEDQAKRTTDNVLKKKIQEQIKQSEEINKSIIERRPAEVPEEKVNEPSSENAIPESAATPTPETYAPDIPYTKEVVDQSLGEDIPSGLRKSKVKVEGIDTQTGKIAETDIEARSAVKDLKTHFRKLEKIINNCL